LDFKVNRDVPNKNEHKYTLEEVLFWLLYLFIFICIKVQLKVKEVFKKVKSDNIDKIVLEDFAKLSQKCNHNLLLNAFFEEYANDKIPEVEKRLEIPLKLTKEKIVTKEEFLKEFNIFLNKSWEIATDVPFLVISLAKIFFLFRKQDICNFIDIEISKSEDYDDAIYFIKDFIEETYKLIKEEVSLV